MGSKTTFEYKHIDDITGREKSDITVNTTDEFVGDLFESFFGFLLACGFQQESINSYILEKAEEIEERNQNAY